MNLSRTHHKALTAIAWRMQDEHGLTFDDAIRAMDGDKTEILREMEITGLPLTRGDLHAWVRENLRRSA